jgi:hypothetical protein
MAGAKRPASGLPLRKSQSAVELGSWRGFGGGGGDIMADGWGDLDVQLGLGGDNTMEQV